METNINMSTSINDKIKEGQGNVVVDAKGPSFTIY